MAPGGLLLAAATVKRRAQVIVSLATHAPEVRDNSALAGTRVSELI